MLHDAIIGIAHDSQKGLAVDNLDAYKMAAELTDLAQKPLSEIINKDNIVIRYYHPGVILIMETQSKPWTGKIEIPANILASFKNPGLKNISYNLFSEDEYRMNCARINTITADGLKMDLDADGCAVIAIKFA